MQGLHPPCVGFFMSQRQRIRHLKDVICQYEQIEKESAGLSSATVDGQTVTWADFQSQLSQYRRDLGFATGRLRRESPINLGGFR